VESPVPGNRHAGFGRRFGETHQWQHWQGAPDRPHVRHEARMTVWRCESFVVGPSQRSG
jgi:hypothetical protein